MQYLLKKNLKIIKRQPEPVDFNGRWKNQHDSTMTLTQTGDGKLTGKYRTQVGKPGDEEEFDLMGYASGDLISFTVNFGKYGSLTAWAGQHTLKNGKAIISTMWHLAVNVEDEQEKVKLWGATWTGADFFEKL